MKDKSDKKKDLQDLKKALADHKNFFVAGYEKMTVSQDNQLRKTVRDAGGSYQVVKNNIAAKASEGTPAGEVLGNLKGNDVAGLYGTDPVALAKALQKYAKDNAAFTFKAGMVEGRVIDIAAISDLASMPPKEEIYAKLLYLINANATRLVSSINGVGRNLAVVMNEAAKENKFQS